MKARKEKRKKVNDEIFENFKSFLFENLFELLIECCSMCAFKCEIFNAKRKKKKEKRIDNEIVKIHQQSRVE